MFIPIRTDRPPKRRPLATPWLIMANFAVCLIGFAGPWLGFDGPQALADWGHFDPQDFNAWQLITYQFIHDPYSPWHILLNMLFLWVFGASVEDRLGRVGFVGFYLVGGIVAALAHAMRSTSPVIGASGSIAGVTGAFLALFPRSRIKVFVLFFIIGMFSVPSLWFIGFYFLVDVLRSLGDMLGSSRGHVAYMAHLAGYVYGFGTGFALLATGILKREEFDVFFLFTQFRRRAAFRKASREGPAGMWTSAQADTGRRLERQRAQAARTPPSPEDIQLAETRARISRLLASGDVKEAARIYRIALGETSGRPPNPGLLLPEQGQLDVANQLYAESAHMHAASAYELLLERYPTSSKSDEVRLMLGLLYARYLHRPQRARELIEQAQPKLREPSYARLADQLLAELAT